LHVYRGIIIAYDVFTVIEGLHINQVNPVSDVSETWDALPDPNYHQPNDEDFYIDVLISADLPFLIYGACFCLAAYGTKIALPALVIKQDAANDLIIKEIDGTINKIVERTGITSEQLKVLQNPAYRKIQWKKSAMSFFCIYCKFCLILPSFQ